MAKGCSSNNYEEARKQRLEENKKRFEVSMDFQTSRKRSRSHSSSWQSYVARPLDEIKEATEEERNRALEAAKALQNNLLSSNPSFTKSMVRSHVYSCFWLGLPSKFCEEYLPKTVYNMILEDENGSEYEAVYIGQRSGLSGGWRAFALEHKLDDGDALIFQLVEAARFKIYIVKAFPDSVEEVGKDTLKEEGNMRATKATKAQKTASNPESGSNKAKTKKQAIVNETKVSESFQEHLPESSIGNGVKPQKVNPTKKTKSSRKMEKKSKVPATAESKGEAQIESVKPKTAIKLSNKTRKSKEGSVHEIGDSGNSEQPLAENNTVKPRGANRGKKKESVQNADSGIKKVEPVGGASKSVSQTPRKKPAPKFFRKKA